MDSTNLFTGETIFYNLQAMCLRNKSIGVFHLQFCNQKPDFPYQ